MNRTLYFFGDSICFGQYITTSKVWTTRIAHHLSLNTSTKDIVAQVTAVNGETSREAMQRLHHCVTSHAPDVVWIQFGLNDANYWQSDFGAPRVSLESYLANINEMIGRCLRFGTSHVLVATNHVVTKKLVHEPSNDRYAENAQMYNSGLRKSIADNWSSDVRLVDIEKQLMNKFSSPGDYLLEDGVHLNEAGHDAYLELALDPILSTFEDGSIR
jgi:lysophospholipase L1-like esterase